MMLKKGKTSLTNKKGFLGLGTVGGFWLVVCCCWHPVSAPRPAPAMPRDRVLLTTGRVTEQTKKFRGDLLDRLVQYLEEHLPGHCLDDLARNHLPTFSEWLEEYMIHLYVNHQTRQSAAETLNALTQKYGFLRHSLGGPWDILRTWDTLEPGQHHLPIPLSVLRALCWNWSKFAVTLALGFYGLLRPSESINMRRQDVSLPHEHLQGDVLYLRVGQPKTRNKAAKQQHVRVDEPGLAFWVETILFSVPMYSRIWHGSLRAFQMRLETILPSSLRPGGATYLFRLWEENLPRLQWRGRWRSFRMLEIYVQELGAAEVWIRFPLKVRSTVAFLGSVFLDVLQACRQ